MTSELIVLIVLTIIAIASAVGLLTSRNAIYAALFLIMNFGAVAVMYLLLNAPFLAIVQISVYAGAIMVLFLFVIMLLGAEREVDVERRKSMRWQRPLALGLGVLLLIQAGYVVFGQLGATVAIAPAVAAGPLEIGRQLFTTYLLPFEIMAVLLLVAMIGAVVLTSDK
jgi:NADH-quinone oxidoreductase subunit J